jgi:Tol biopolymer transport system component/DNA-binding winged helix-turn-helix (wHTH) protein
VAKELTPRVYSFGEFELDPARRLLSRAGQPVSLNAKAFDLLVALVENGGRILSKDELMDLIWRDQFVEEANLAVQISTLRKALGEHKDEHRFIVTVSGQGYRFVAPLNSPEGFIVERDTVSQIVIEQETDEKKELPQLTTGASRRRYVFAAAAFLACLVAAFGVYKFLNQPRIEVPFQKIKLARLTNDGKVTGVTVSPDGKFIAYALSQSEGSSLRVQQVGTASSIPILPQTKAEIWGLTFSPDGSYLYYSLFSANRADPGLFRIPSLGGVAQKIPNLIAHAITFSPDGKRFAYIQPDSAAGFNYLMVADADGGNSHAIAKRKHPNSFEHQWHVAAWSPDGKIIACVANHFDADASYSSIIGVDARDGTEKPLSAERWYDVLSIEWLKDGRGLAISAHKKSSGNNQIWFVPYPEGAGRQITNDLAQYDWLGVSANGPSLVAQQTNTANSIFIGEPQTDPSDFKEVASEVGPLSPLVWTPEGKVVFRSNKDGVSNLWIMEADGSKRTQLTANAQVDSRGLCMSPDGKQLIFTSQRSGKSNLWRFDADGGSLAQLTDGEADVYPQCSPDGRWVVYQKSLRTNPRLWKVPLAGGAPTPLTEFLAKWPAISNDGSRVAYFHMNKGKWNIGIVSSDGGPMLQRLDVPPRHSKRVVYWSEDDRWLYYISTVGDVGNVWALPLDGGEPKPVTNFTTHSVEDFAWSPDGKRLAVARSTRLSDVVLIEDVR